MCPRQLTAEYGKTIGKFEPTGFTDIEVWEKMPPSWVTALHSWEAEDKASEAELSPAVEPSERERSSVITRNSTKGVGVGVGAASPCAKFGAPSTSHCAKMKNLGDAERTKVLCANCLRRERNGLPAHERSPGALRGGGVHGRPGRGKAKGASQPAAG